MRFPSWAATAMAGALIATSAHTAELGIDAPELTQLDWIKGEPVRIADGKDDTIFVVEFWATWCGPCRDSVSHLTELQKQYADDNVVFIGISDEDPATVAAFAEAQGDAMDYRVAVATDRGPHKAYMEAFNQGGIPTAFVVDKQGRIAWLGHPIELDEVLASIVAGTHDIEKAKRRLAAVNDFNEITDLAFMGDNEAFLERGNAALEQYTDMPEALLELAWLIFNIQGMSEANRELGARLAQKGFQNLDEPTAVAHLVYATALADQGKHAEAVEVLEQGLPLIKENQDRLREIMDIRIAEWSKAPVIVQ